MKCSWHPYHLVVWFCSIDEETEVHRSKVTCPRWYGEQQSHPPGSLQVLLVLEEINPFSLASLHSGRSSLARLTPVCLCSPLHPRGQRGMALQRCISHWVTWVYLEASTDWFHSGLTPSVVRSKIVLRGPLKL